MAPATSWIKLQPRLAVRDSPSKAKRFPSVNQVAAMQLMTNTTIRAYPAIALTMARIMDET
jgi:hypothetical protein